MRKFNHCFFKFIYCITLVNISGGFSFDNGHRSANIQCLVLINHLESSYVFVLFLIY